jgi:phage terminase large subunit-like protein
MTYGLGVGPLKYRAQYDQNPANAEGGEIKTSYWRFYSDKRYESTHRPAGCVTAETHPAVALPAQVARIISADTAVKENQTADWSVVGAIAHARADVFLTDLDRARVAMPGLIKMFKLACARYPDARQKYVEDKSSGSQLIQLLKVGGEVDGYKFDATPGIVPVDPGNDQQGRAHAHPPATTRRGRSGLPTRGRAVARRVRRGGFGISVRRS